jgi:TonB family protein
MEYAEQTLAEILTLRALTFEEVRQMSGPALAALSFLHRNRWVHGQVKPPNVCVVGDQLKLSSDTLRPAGDPLSGSVDSTAFRAPEETSGDVSAAGDVWGMGMTLVAALNQHPAPPPDGSSPPIVMPSTVPPAFADALRRSLSPEAAKRPTAAELEGLLLERDTIAPAPRSPSRASSRDVPRGTLVGGIAGIVVLLGVIWGSVRLLHGGARHGPSPTSPALSAAASASDTTPLQTSPRPARRAVPQPAPPSDPVLHKEIPAVTHSALRTIRGRIDVFVTVTVDASGNVVDQTLERSSSSKYFARAAAGAAKKWRFAPAAAAEARRWRLRFEFTRFGASATASPAS